MPPRRRRRRHPRPPSPSSSSSSSSTSLKEFREQVYYTVFPEGRPYRDLVGPPPSPPYSNSSFIVPPNRPSRPQPCVIHPHPLFPGVFVAADHDHDESCNKVLYTRNLDEDGQTVEYREWDPFKSRLASAILSGIQNMWIKPGSRVLILYSRDDQQFGITISHISDIVGPQGMVYVVETETSNHDTLLNMADKRGNIVPIVYCMSPDPMRYRMLINMVDVMFAAPDRPEEVHMAYLNSQYFLKTGGHYMLYVQGHTMESTNRGDGLFSSMSKVVQVQYQRMEQVTLEPFDREHVYVSGVYRTMEIAEIDESCLVSSKFWTSQDSNSGAGRPLSLYEKQKNLPVFMLFESSFGYVLFRAHDVYKVERNYVATEKYIKSFDKSYEFVASHTFESTDEALMYLTADYNDTLPEKLMEFLVLHLPPPMEGDEHCLSLALFNPLMEDKLAMDAKIACSASPFHIDIIRGVRMNLDKFFKNMKPGDLEKAQLDLARICSRQKLNSPDKRKLLKKRGHFQARAPTRENPKRKARADAKTEKR
ncbi:hypothetical protein ACET3Z_025441 [Daucus carota]